MRVAAFIRGARVARPTACRFWLAGVCLLGGLGLSLALAADEGEDGWPLPLKRIVIPPARVSLEQARLNQGVLLQLPLKEFDDLVRKAGEARKESKLVASLVRSSYTAELSANSLAGTGTWTVHNPAAGPAVLPMPSLNLALSKVRNETGGEVVLGELDGKNLGLLVDKAGAQPIYFDWSARGTTGPGGLVFDLKLPPCPLAHLELKVPADQVVSLPRSAALLTGPLPAESPQKSIWRLGLTGKSRVELAIRSLAGSADLPPAQLAQLAAKQEITPERIKAEFDFQVEVLHHPVRELIFDCDPVLHPYEVSLRNAEIQNWKFQAAPPPKNKDDKPLGTVIVQLREPFQGTLAGLRLRCLAPRAAQSAWTSPFVRLRQSLSRGETLKLHVHPDVQLEMWDPGNFRLLSATTGNDGTQILTLVDPRTGAQAARRPTCVCKTQGLELHTVEKVWWHLGATGSHVQAEITFDPARGNLYQLALKLPRTAKKWQVEKVELEPADLLQTWSAAGTLLEVDLRQGLGPRTPAKLNVRLFAPWDSAAVPTGALLDFPDLEPAYPSTREGIFHVSVDPLFQASLVQHSTAPIASEVENPWGPPPAFSFPFRGQATAGKLRLMPNRSALRAALLTRVLLGRESASVQTRLELDPLAGSLQHCDLLVTGGNNASWQVREDKPAGHMVRLQRLPPREHLPRLFALANPLPWASWPLPEVAGPLEVWRLHFAPALSKQAVFHLETTVRSPRGAWWDLPQITLMNTPRRDGAVHLRTSGVDITSVRTSGLVVDAGQARLGHDTHAENDFSFVPRAVPRLQVQAAPVPALPMAQEKTDQARLITHVLEDGRLLHHFSFRIVHWRKTEIPVLLAGGDIRIVAAKVNERWLENVPFETTGQGVEARFPADLGSTRQKIDLFYSTEASWSTWPGWSRLEVPWPLLPVVPLTRERSWRLAPGLTPLQQHGWDNISLPDGMNLDNPDLVRQAWHLGEPLLQSRLPLSQRQSAQQQALLDAEAALRRKWSRDMTLGDALQQLIFDHLKDRAILVLDAAALAAEELHPSTPITVNGDAPFWEALGLVHVPCHDAPLLTTRKQLDLWQRQVGFSPSDLDQSVSQVLRGGRDRQGVLQTAAFWLRHAVPAPVRSHGLSGDFPRGLFSGQLPPGWSAWQARQGKTDSAGMIVVRQEEMRTFGVILALVTVVVLWNMGRFFSGVWFFRGLVTWMTAWGLAFLWLPTPLHNVALGPLFTAGLFGLVAYVLLLLGGTRRVARRSLSTQSMPKPVGVVGAVLLFALGLYPSMGQSGADPYTVLILTGSGEIEARALVSPELLQRLKDVSRSAFDGRTSSVLVRGDYHGQVKGSLLAFQAQFDVFNFANKGRLVLPLTGIDLQEGSFLDGAPVYPVPLGGPQGGFSVTMTGKGFHRLTLSFTTRWHATAEYQELHFGIPSLVQSHLQLTVPPGWQDVQVTLAQGESKIENLKGQQTIRTQLGRENQVHVRWRPEAGAGMAASVEVQEAYLWDLRPGFFSLTGLLNYNITKGSVNQLSLSIPADAEVRAVELGGAAVQAGRIRKWRVTGKDKGRQLHVDLASPLTGKFQLVLGLFPRNALDAGHVQLYLPVPLNAKHQEGVLAYRLEGWEATDKTQNLAITRTTPELVVKAWQAAGQRDPGLPSRAYSFRRTAGESWLLVALQPFRPLARQEIHCDVQPSFTDLQVDVHVQGIDEDFSFVEVAVPADMTLADVRGPKLHHWSRQGALVQVWLQQPVREITLHLTGWVKNALPQADGKPGRFVLPSIATTQARLQSTTVKLRGGPGLALEPEKLVGLVREGESEAYQASGAYAGTFRIRPVQLLPEARILTTVGMHHGTFDFSTRIDCSFLRGDAHELRLLLRNWPSDDVHLDLFLPGARTEHQRQGDEHSWKILLPAGPLRPFAAVLRGQRPVDAREKLLVPAVELAQSRERGRWVVLNGSELQPTVKKGLVAVKDWSQDLRVWPTEATRIRRDAQVWKVKDASWQLQVQARTHQTALPWSMLWGEHEIQERDGRWLHQADFLISTRTATTIEARLPARANFLAASWGEEILVPRLGNPGEVHLTLSQALTGQVLRLRWSYPDADETAGKPRLDAPVFPGADEIPSAVTLWLPEGYETRTVPGSAVEPLLHRARAQMLLCSLLAEEAREQKTSPPEASILGAQKLFQEWVRQAEYEALAESSGSPAQARESARAALKDLRQQNQRRAQQGQYEALRDKAEKSLLPIDGHAGPGALQLPQRGLPLVYSPVPLGQTLLQPAPAQEFGVSVVASQLLLVGFLALLFLSSLPRLFRSMPAFWPEQAMAVALVGTLLFGVSILGLILFLAGVVGRLTWVTMGLLGVWSRVFSRDTAP